MSNMKGAIRGYVRTVARGDAFTMPQLARHMGLNSKDPEAVRRIGAAVNGIRRDGVIDPDTEIVLKTLEPGQVWIWENYKPQPINQAAIYANATPLPDGSGPFREVTADLEEDDEEPPAQHVCAYTVVGTDADGKPLVRDPNAQIWRLTEI